MVDEKRTGAGMADRGIKGKKPAIAGAILSLCSLLGKAQIVNEPLGWGAYGNILCHRAVISVRFP